MRFYFSHSALKQHSWRNKSNTCVTIKTVLPKTPCNSITDLNIHIKHHSVKH